MKAGTVTFLFFSLFVLFQYGCGCDFPGKSGIDCTEYAMRNGLSCKMNMDSTTNGFKLQELNATYIVKYESDSVNAFAHVVDTTYLYDDRNIDFTELTNALYPYNLYVYERDRNVNYTSGFSYKIINSNSQVVNEITNIKIIFIGNDSKCCSKYVAQEVSSYLLNGALKSNDKTIVINKK
ncbi:MAG: hypothetical protein V4643_05985 [Bacteroidota bacterium]